MNLKKYIIHLSVALLALFVLVGISTPAAADDLFNPFFPPTPFNAVCQSGTFLLGSPSAYQGCETATTGNPPAVLVPAKPGQCFYLTDVTLFNNNGSREVDLRNASNSRAYPAAVVLASSYNGGPTLTVQDWQAPIVFTGALYADVHTPNNNVYVTVSGYYYWCPGAE